MALLRGEFWRPAALLTIAGAVYLWGICKDLPYAPNVDEPSFVAPAVHMASHASPDPQWFGHPGSTVIYPLSFLLKTWSVLADAGSFFRPDLALEQRFDEDPSGFYLLGRYLSVAYALLGVLATYEVGRLAFGATAGFSGALLSIFAPDSVWHGRLVRTDAAGVFFAMLALACCLRLLAAPSRWRQVTAGVAIGFAIGTRYFLAALVTVLLLVDAVLLLEARNRGERLRDTLLGAVAGLLSVLAGFAVSTPYFFIHFSTVLNDLRLEGGSHLGADGLGFWRNLAFYGTDAIPQNLGVPQAILAGIGLLAVWWREQAEGRVLIAYSVVLLFYTCGLELHWTRWMIQLFPVLSLFAAQGIVEATRLISSKRRARLALLICTLLVTVAVPARAVMLVDYRDSHPSTAVLAREWILSHLSRGSAIVEEEFGPMLPRGAYRVLKTWRLDQPPDKYCTRGYRYVVVSLLFYYAAISDRSRHQEDVGIYEKLFREDRLLAEFPWSRYQGGSTVRVYELSCS